MTTTEAHRIYLDYHQPRGDSWGPFINYSNSREGAEFSKRIDNILLQSTITPNGSIVTLPSAWHAAIFLMRLNQITRNQLKQPLLFRGQGNPSWRIVSSLHRIADTNKKSEERTATVLFSMYLYRRLHYPSISLRSYVAVARHMGFATHHTDWTLDPSVAVCFASQNSPSDLTSSHGRVFLLHSRNAVEMELGVQCTPPFCERVYSQLGVFLTTDSAVVNNANPDYLSVVFPKPAKDDPFVAWRDGQKIDLFGCHPWLESAAAQARQLAKENPLAIDDNEKLVDIVDSWIQSAGPIPVELINDSPFHRAKWSIKAIDFFHWLFIFINDDATDTIILPEIGIPIIRQNYEITELAVRYFDYLAVHKPDIDVGNLPAALRKLLQLAGKSDPFD